MTHQNLCNEFKRIRTRRRHFTSINIMYKYLNLLQYINFLNCIIDRVPSWVITIVPTTIIIRTKSETLVCPNQNLRIRRCMIDPFDELERLGANYILPQLQMEYHDNTYNLPDFISFTDQYLTQFKTLVRKEEQ